jgi:signal recognition particle receptor subunit beta
MLHDLIEQYGLLPILTLAAAPVLALIMARLMFGRQGMPMTVGGPKRTKYLLCGPVGSGKTTIWQTLVHGAAKPTHTSMVPNLGKVRPEFSGSVELVDFPGHNRLKDDIAPFLPSAKVIIVVMDAVSAMDEGVGVHAVAALLARLVEDRAVTSGASIIVAANKRDDVTSFSAKAIKKKLEAELTTLFASRSSSVGKVPGGNARKGSAGPTKRSETGVFLEEGETFSFESSCSVEVGFVDISAVKDDTFNLKPLTDLMA